MEIGYSAWRKEMFHTQTDNVFGICQLGEWDTFNHNNVESYNKRIIDFSKPFPLWLPVLQELSNLFIVSKFTAPEDITNALDLIKLCRNHLVFMPTCVMTSYNAVNGIYPAENAEVLQDLVRGEWGFEGLIMTDWGTYDTVDPVEMVKAGNCWLTEGSPKYAKILLRAVENGDLKRSVLENNVRALVQRILNNT